jgi:prephenate dehydratase
MSRMEWPYYTNPQAKEQIDELLKTAAMLFAYTENTPEAKRMVQEREKEILALIANVDPQFAEACGWENPSAVEEDSESERVLQQQALDYSQEVQG